MKLTPFLQQAQELMRPGKVAKSGFLGTDPRDLAQILQDQHAECARLGVSPRDIGLAMRRIGYAGKAGFGSPVPIEGKWTVAVDENRGKIPSPFPEPGVFQKTLYTVRHDPSGKTVRYTELTIHLVAKHGFFGGVGAPFYVSPAELVEVLEVARSGESTGD